MGQQEAMTNQSSSRPTLGILLMARTYLPTLRAVFPAGDDAAKASESGLQRSFYTLSFFFVVPLMFLGGYLLWRDTRRESRVAETLQMADETNSSDPRIRARAPSIRTPDRCRAKVEDDASTPRRLIAVHGVGYKLILS